jgi:glycerol-3-phosphate dehydrogenase (NAD(P)+)
MQIGVIGGGSWGTALAHLLANKGHDISMWCHDDGLVDIINEEHENTKYLPGFELPEQLVATEDLHECVRDRDMIVTVSPSHVTREVLERVADELPTAVPIVSATKGIENETLMTISEVLEDVLPGRCHPYLAYLSGPSFAKEVVDRRPTAVTIASYNHRLAVHVQETFSCDYFRCYTTHDVIGVELGGAVKNVIAIAAGAAESMELGHNSTAGMITRGLAEITRFGSRLGANPLTLSGLAGMGDLVLTCTGGLSRNRQVGQKLGKGKKLEQILDEMDMVAEGIKTSKSVYDLSNELGVEMPICEEVYQVIYEGKEPRQSVADIMNRELKPELWGGF